MDTKRAEELIDKFNKGTLSPEEEAMLDSWYLSLYKDEMVNITDEDLQGRKLAVLNRLEGRYRKIPELRLWPRIAVAAAAVAAIVFGVWFFNSESGVLKQVQDEVVYKNDIAPGKNGATLTLANGKVIQLSGAKSGVVVGNGLKYIDGAEILKQVQDDGQDGERSVTLTASTAKGQTYQFTLPDGTKVWLNADSKLEFPSNFVNSKTRNVILAGEGYFEVAKDKKHPFVVQMDKQEVEVLGTHFNINAYKDESNIKTTLLEGSVRVARFSPIRGSLQGDERSVILKPNQQSILSGSNGIIVKQVNPEEAVAWKEGVFIFNSTPLDQIMRQVSRWYNVEIIYENPELKGELMGGSVSRYDNVSRILKTLENTGAIKFRIAGGKVYVGK